MIATWYEGDELFMLLGLMVLFFMILMVVLTGVVSYFVSGVISRTIGEQKRRFARLLLWLGLYPFVLLMGCFLLSLKGWRVDMFLLTDTFSLVIFWIPFCTVYLVGTSLLVWRLVMKDTNAGSLTDTSTSGNIPTQSLQLRKIVSKDC
jgi:hypothetical protein